MHGPPEPDCERIMLLMNDKRHRLTVTAAAAALLVLLLMLYADASLPVLPLAAFFRVSLAFPPILCYNGL